MREPNNRFAHGARSRIVWELRRPRGVDSTALSRSICETLRDNAVGPTFRGRNGSQLAREPSIRPHHCA
eukprot:4487447-Lingulodinium_polyedra.AAC.1